MSTKHLHLPQVDDMPNQGEHERRITFQDLQAIWELLEEIKKAQDIHLAAEVELRPKLLELIGILEKSKGALFFLKALIYVGGVVGACLLWAKDHVKL